MENKTTNQKIEEARINAVIELIYATFTSRTPEQLDMMSKYAEVHVKNEEYYHSKDTLSIGLFILNDLFEQFPALTLSNKKYKGHDRKWVKSTITLAEIQALSEVLNTEQVEDQVNELVKKSIVDYLSAELKDAEECKLGYGNNPLVTRVTMISEKTMAPKLTSTIFYSIK